jgi:hypothetical protein
VTRLAYFTSARIAGGSPPVSTTGKSLTPYLLGIVNLFVEKKIIDELKRGKGVESKERLGVLSC